jgi:hypothetical protein
MATDSEVSPILGKQKSKGGRPLNSIWEDINKGESVGSGKFSASCKYCENEFGRINVVIENLQNEINQHYAVVQRTQQSMTNDSEAELGNSGDSTSASTNSSPSSSSSGSSNLSGIFDITGDIKIRFKQHFDRLMKARNYTFDEMCYSVAVDIRSLGGSIKISTVKNFYSGVGRSTVPTVNQINAWVNSFNNNNTE